MGAVSTELRYSDRVDSMSAEFGLPGTAKYPEVAGDSLLFVLGTTDCF